MGIVLAEGIEAPGAGILNADATLLYCATGVNSTTVSSDGVIGTFSIICSPTTGGHPTKFNGKIIELRKNFSGPASARVSSKWQCVATGFDAKYLPDSCVAA